MCWFQTVVGIPGTFSILSPNRESIRILANPTTISPEVSRSSADPASHRISARTHCSETDKPTKSGIFHSIPGSRGKRPRTTDPSDGIRIPPDSSPHGRKTHHYSVGTVRSVWSSKSIIWLFEEGNLKISSIKLKQIETIFLPCPSKRTRKL